MSYSVNKARLLATISDDEGRRKIPYVDTEGYLSIGVGRNLDSRGLSDDEIDYLLANDVRLAMADAASFTPVVYSLCPERQEVLVNMAFNLGLSRLSGFRLFKAALERGDFEAAAREMLDSRWAKQVGRRATRLSEIMRTGEFPE